MKKLIIIPLVLFLTIPAFAGEAGRFGLGINYGLVSNLKAWNSQSSEAGSMLRIDYSYDFNDFYTAAVEIGFFADENVFKSASVTTYVQTIASLAIDHIFHTRQIGPFSPHLKLGTVIYGSNLWRKMNNSFYHNATDVSADISVGAGAEFDLWQARANVDISLPALFHVAYLSGKLPYIVSFGWKYYF